MYSWTVFLKKFFSELTCFWYIPHIIIQSRNLFRKYIPSTVFSTKDLIDHGLRKFIV